MLARTIETDKIVDIFPHMEKILHCGFFSSTGLKEFWSEGIYAILGVESESISANLESFCSFVVDEDRDRVSKAIVKSRGNSSTLKIEFSVLSADNTTKRINAESIDRGENDDHSEHIMVLEDITESYYYKKELELKVSQLNKSNSNLQEFVYVASHDLTEPLRKITTFADRLKQKYQAELGTEGNTYLTRLQTSGYGMQALLQELLTFSKLSPGEAKFEQVSIKECLENVISDLEIKIEETKTSIFSSGLGVIDAYPSQINQLLSNLISNAIKFRKKGLRPMIRISYREVPAAAYPQFPKINGGSYIEIVVEDNGIGFEQEFSEKIFQIFQRLNARSEYNGSGIGLAICKKIVENHHGTIFAKGQPGVGSSFTVLLPKKQT